MGKNVTADMKDDALALAQLIYDVFTESKSSDNIENGQNNAQSNEN